MNCQRCKDHQATVHVTEVLEFVRPGDAQNKQRTMHVCDLCAKKLHLPHAPGMQPTMADNIWKLLQYSAKKVRVQQRTLHCKECGMSLEELRRNGKLGCANDYVVFKDHLDELLERMHGAQEHVGRVPGIGEGELERIQRVSDLKGDLELAIRQEDYEAAAAIRDQLKVLEVEHDDQTA